MRRKIDYEKYNNTFNKDKDRDLIKLTYDEKFYKENPVVPDEYRGHLKNYHTHTYRCNHGTGDIYDFCFKALECGFDTIGFSEHNPFPDNKWLPDMRMDIGELDDYINDIQQGRKDFPELNLYIGLECDYRKEWDSFYSDYLLGEKKIEYLTGSVHVYPGKDGEYRGVHGEIMDRSMMDSYLKCMMDIIESGHFKYINHPDLFGQQLDKWTPEARAMSRYFIEAAKDKDIPLELNVSGICKKILHPDEKERLLYPIVQFWEEVADIGVKVIIGTDAHNPIRLDTNLWYGIKLANELGLNVIESLDI